METVTDFILGATKSLQMVTAAMKLKDTWKKSYDQHRQHIKKQRHYFADNGPSSQGYGFSSGLGWMGRRKWQPTPVFLGFPGGSAGKESACNVGDLGSIPGLGRSPGVGHGNPLQYSCPENPHG